MTHVMSAHRDRRGTALATVIFATTMMTVIGAVVLAIGVQEARIGDNARYSAKAFSAAEAGIAGTLAQWKASRFDTLTPGDSVPVTGAAVGGGRYAGNVRRLSVPMFLVTMSGTERQTMSSRAQTRLGQVVVQRTPHISIKGALTTEGTVKVAGTSTISGTNTPPSGWTGCPPAASISGITVRPGDTVTVSGSAQVTGSSPAISQDSSVTSSTFNNFGSTTYSQLAASADIQLAAGTYNGIAPALTPSGACDISVTTNWGDGSNPTGACSPYFPVIHLSGASTIDGGEGQGILLVDGNLKLTGGFVFYGIVVTEGTFDASGTGGLGATVYGAVLAQDATINTSLLSGNAQVQYSACVIQRALNGAATAKALDGRGWFTQ